ncbi:hypothetical protein [Kribbella sp. NPDC048915]|uniref:hypothetical protein n=1 Tax=Kribbella sp. NPDC048915 TaxID=3155148 RepID=UPI0033CEA983
MPTQYRADLAPTQYVDGPQGERFLVRSHADETSPNWAPGTDRGPPPLTNLRQAAFVVDAQAW